MERSGHFAGVFEDFCDDSDAKFRWSRREKIGFVWNFDVFSRKGGLMGAGIAVLTIVARLVGVHWIEGTALIA